jgi:hypothetical protein
MTAAGEVIAELQKERRGGNVSGETEQHLKHEFRKLGWNASDSILGAARTLRKLRAPLFGVA